PLSAPLASLSLHHALPISLLITLPQGPYTAIVTGAGNSTGLGLVEVFEADASVVSELSNISTRGFVQSGDGVMIGGLIITPSPLDRKMTRLNSSPCPISHA